MAKKIKVRIRKEIVVKMTQEEFVDLKDACFEDGDRQMLNEMVDLDCDGILEIREVAE